MRGAEQCSRGQYRILSRHVYKNVQRWLDPSVCSGVCGQSPSASLAFRGGGVGHFAERRWQLGQGLAFSDESLQEFYLVRHPNGACHSR